MKKEIKFSLVFRDMWQSAGKYVPLSLIHIWYDACGRRNGKRASANQP